MLFWCSVGFAVVGSEDDWIKKHEAWKNSGGDSGDPNKNEILESTKDYIVIRNLTAKANLYHSGFERMQPANVFGSEANLHCEKNDIFNGASKAKIFDDHTVYYYCEGYLSDFYSWSTDTEETKLVVLTMCMTEWSSGMERYNFWKCKKRIKKARKKYPDLDQSAVKL